MFSKTNVLEMYYSSVIIQLNFNRKATTRTNCWKRSWGVKKGLKFILGKITKNWEDISCTVGSFERLTKARKFKLAQERKNCLDKIRSDPLALFNT